MAALIRTVVNPVAGHGAGRRALPALRRIAAAHGASLAVADSVDDLKRHARRAAADGADRLVVAGGDGTLHHALQEIAGTHCALGIVPVGRGNDLARHLALPRGFEKAARAAFQGGVQTIDVGRVGDRVFASVAGVGMDGRVLESLRSRWVRPLPATLAYVVALLATLRSFRPVRLRAEHDGGAWEGEATEIAVANARFFGAGMRIAPAAVADDGLLDLVIIRSVSRAKLLRVFPRVYSGRHAQDPDVSFISTRRVVLRAVALPMVQADGELLPRSAHESIEFSVWPAALRVVSPDAQDGSQASPIPSLSPSA